MVWQCGVAITVPFAVPFAPRSSYIFDRLSSFLGHLGWLREWLRSNWEKSWVRLKCHHLVSHNVMYSNGPSLILHPALCGAGAENFIIISTKSSRTGETKGKHNMKGREGRSQNRSCWIKATKNKFKWFQMTSNKVTKEANYRTNGSRNGALWNWQLSAKVTELGSLGMSFSVAQHGPWPNSRRDSVCITEVTTQPDTDAKDMSWLRYTPLFFTRSASVTPANGNICHIYTVY